MIQGMAEHILNRGVVSNLARFCPEADLIVATQHRSLRRPLLLASLQVLFALEDHGVSAVKFQRPKLPAFLRQ